MASVASFSCGLALLPTLVGAFGGFGAGTTVRLDYPGRFFGNLYNLPRRQAIEGAFEGNSGFRMAVRMQGWTRLIEENLFGYYPVRLELSKPQSGSFYRSILLKRRSIRLYGSVSGLIQLRNPVKGSKLGRQRLKGWGVITS